MSTINELTDRSQEQSSDIEEFGSFKTKHALAGGLKGRIKAFGCHWDFNLHKWICPMIYVEEVKSCFQKAQVSCDYEILRLPKGFIPANPKVAQRQSRLDALLHQAYQEERKLLVDIYQYDPSLRPEDFNHPREEDDKTTIQIQIEADFYQRRLDWQQKQDQIEKLGKELNHFNNDPGSKILDSKAPLSIVDEMINLQFRWQQDRVLYFCSDVFWKWNGMQYVEMQDDEVRKIIYTYLRDAKEHEDQGGLKDFNPTKYKVDLVIDALKSVCHEKLHPSSGNVWIDGRSIPDPKHLIVFRNGILNLDEWLKNPEVPLTPHTPHLMNVNSKPFDFASKVGISEQWLKFVESLWPNDQGSQDLLQEWMGYLLTQDTRFQKILLMIGPSRSGKGTIGRIVRELIGHANVAGPTLSSLGGDFGLQQLLNMSLALISDVRTSGKGNTVIIERLLSISGEDPLSINRKFLPALTTQLPTRITMMSNELPDLRDASGALAKRYLVLFLKKSWLGNEDTALFDRLKEELPGISIWALQGLSRLYKRGHFVVPTSSKEIVEELEAMTSPIKAFVVERCDLNHLAKVLVDDLFNAWCDWCCTNGHERSGNKQTLGKNLRAAFPEIQMERPQKSLQRERWYIGIKLV